MFWKSSNSRSTTLSIQIYQASPQTRGYQCYHETWGKKNINSKKKMKTGRKRLRTSSRQSPISPHGVSLPARASGAAPRAAFHAERGAREPNELLNADTPAARTDSLSPREVHSRKPVAARARKLRRDARAAVCRIRAPPCPGAYFAWARGERWGAVAQSSGLFLLVFNFSRAFSADFFLPAYADGKCTRVVPISLGWLQLVGCARDVWPIGRRECARMSALEIPTGSCKASEMSNVSAMRYM